MNERRFGKEIFMIEHLSCFLSTRGETSHEDTEDREQVANPEEIDIDDDEDEDDNEEGTVCFILSSPMDDKKTLQFYRELFFVSFINLY